MKDFYTALPETVIFGRNFRKAVFASIFLGSCAIPALAQDLDKILPEPVPQLVEPEPVYSPEQQQFFAESIGAKNGETIILKELKGVILLHDETALHTIKLSSGETVRLHDVHQISAAGKIELRRILKAFIGLPVSAESLNRLKSAIKFHLSQHGRPFSLVYTPEQDVTDGYVQIVVKESTTGSIRVEGAHYFSDKSYLSRIRQRPGMPIDAIQLRQDLDRINGNPFRAAAVQVEKGKEPATTDVIIKAKERRPFRTFIGYNNTGNETTEVDRMTAGVNWGNAFGLGHQMTVQLTSDLDIEHSKGISANYTMDLANGHSATVFGAYSRILGTEPGFNQEGESWQIGMNYDVPLAEMAKSYTHRLQLGLDFKSSDNNLELELPFGTVPISDNLTHVVQGRIQYRGSWNRDTSTTGFGGKLTFSPGDLSSYNDDDAFNLSRSMATADYLYANLDVYRSTTLSGPLGGWRWNVRAEAQLSASNLLGSEQFTAGGSGTVRGYEEGEIAGDNALFFTQELLLPIMRPATDLFHGKVPDSLATFLFHDFAKTWNVDELAGERALKAHSIGAGFRYNFSLRAAFQIAHGWQLRDSRSSNTGDNRRWHVSVQISY